MPGNSMKNTHNLLSNTKLERECVCECCMRINYTASILFPFVGLIFGKHSTELSLPLSLLFAIHLYTFFATTYHYFLALYPCPIFISSKPTKPTNRFVEIHLNERISNVEHTHTLYDYYFQDILQMFIVVSLRRELLLGSGAKNIMEIVTRWYDFYRISQHS